MNFGFDFRATLGYVTDPSYAAAVLGEAYPNTYSNADGASIVAGWTGGVATRDRIAWAEPRLAGLNGSDGSGTITFKVALPGPGQYGIVAAFGDEGNDETCTVTFADDTATIVTYTGVSVASFHSMDASGNVYEDHVFFASQTPLVHTFTSSVLKVTTAIGTATEFLQVTSLGPPPKEIDVLPLKGSQLVLPYPLGLTPEQCAAQIFANGQEYIVSADGLTFLPKHAILTVTPKG